jgi:hypothetical protein
MAESNEGLWLLADEQRQLVEAWLVEFDGGWREGLLAERARGLPAGPLRLPALVEMVKIDLERRWQRGARATLEDYLGAYPELGGPDGVPLSLIRAEHEVLLQFGARVRLEEYARRFPGRAEAVRQALGRVDEERPSSPASVKEEHARRLALLGEPELKQIACWKLEGLANEEIAARLDCALSTVERKWKRIRDLWKQEGPR